MNRHPKRQQSERRTSSPRRLSLALLALGAFLVLVPQNFSWSMFSSNTKNSLAISAAADWTPPTVTINDLPDAVRGTVTINVTASDMETGIKNVSIYRALSDTTTWTLICTDAVAPYSCAWNTTALAEDYYDIRAVATDNSNYTTEDIEESVLVDNTAPTGALGTIASPIAGTITITATASDAGSGVDNVAIQRATAGGTTFTTICTATEPPFSCRFDSTQVSDGLYDFRAIVTDEAGNTFTTAKVTNRIVSNIFSSVSVDPPASYLRGTVTINASANAALGVVSVKIQRAPNGTTTWTDICTDTSSPYSCSWNTTTVTDGAYIFRAILTDTLGQVTTSATAGPSTVDNTVVRGYDVQTTSGGSAGKLSTGDTITYTFSRAMNLNTISSGWTGTSKAVVLRFRDGALLGTGSSTDTIDIFTTTAFSTAVNLGTVNMAGNYVKANKTVAFNATMVSGTTTVNGVSATTVTITVGAVASGSSTGNLRTVSGTASMIWTPSALATDTFGNATSTSPTTELGTKDRDL